MSRKIVISAVVILLPVTVALWGYLLTNTGGPDTKTLIDDLATLDVQIAQAEKDAATYVPTSLAGAQAQVRLMVLKTTRDMLDQKRLSWLRGIALRYQIDGRALRDITPEEVAHFEALRATAKAKAEAAHAKAAQYSGGLVQGLAIAEEQTALLTLAMIDLQQVTARWNVAIPAISMRDDAPPLPLGRSANDKGAL